MTSFRSWPLPRPNLPLWVRWVLSLTVAAAVLVALVRFVSTHNTVTLAEQSPQALAREHRQDDILTAQDQAPHVVALPASARRWKFVHGVVAADMNAKIQHGLIGGTLQHVACRTAGRQGARLGFTCVAVAADVNYDYAGVIQSHVHRVVWCRHDAPPIPNQPIPLNRRCLP
ncbi:MAG: hypothetical protein ACRDLV_02165 [Solirubrobacteraceae bacterium]